MSPAARVSRRQLRWRGSLIDGLSLVLLVVGLPALGLGYVVVQRVGPVPRQELGRVWMFMKVTIPASIVHEHASAFTYGHILQRDHAGRPVVKVLGVGSSEPNQISVPMNKTDRVTVNAADQRVVPLHVLVLATATDSGLFFGQWRLIAKAPVEFDTAMGQLRGMIRSIEDRATKPVKLTVQYEAVSCEIVARVRPGDESGIPGWGESVILMRVNPIQETPFPEGPRCTFTAELVGLATLHEPEPRGLYIAGMWLEPGRPFLFESLDYWLVGRIMTVQPLKFGVNMPETLDAG